MGELVLANGDRYTGEFKGDKKHGQGEFTWASGEFAGDQFIGQYQDNLRTGPGKYTWADGSVHKGQWL